MQLTLPLFERLGALVQLARELLQRAPRARSALPRLLTAAAPSPVAVSFDPAGRLGQLRLAQLDVLHPLAQRLLEVFELTQPVLATALGLARWSRSTLRSSSESAESSTRLRRRGRLRSRASAFSVSAESAESRDFLSKGRTAR